MISFARKEENLTYVSSLPSYKTEIYIRTVITLDSKIPPSNNLLFTIFQCPK